MTQPLFRIGILADDLTGAGDVGGCFARAGFRTVVVLPFNNNTNLIKRNVLSASSASGATPEVFVIDTESRYEVPEVAQLRVTEAVRALSFWGANFFYKKIDSALRGNVGPEMDAFLESLLARGSRHISKGDSSAFISEIPVVAAYPEAGRQTRSGWQVIDGVRLDRSPFARDPRGTVRQAHIPTFLQETCHSWLFFKVENCVEHSDMRRLAAQALKQHSLSGFYACVGSAGLARDMASILAGGEKSFAQETAGKDTLNHRLPTIVVCGSRHPSSLGQIDKFLGSSGRNSIVIEGPGRPDMNFSDVARSLSLGRQTPTVVVRSTGNAKEPGAVAGWLARTTRRVLRAIGPGQLVLMGGDTAYSVCEGLGVRKLAIRRMEVPGIAICEPLGSETERTPKIVLKPGGFGSPSTLIDILKN